MHKPSADASFSPKVILAVAAHPDDIEFCMAGSIAHWIQDGADVYYLIMTDGGNGAPDGLLSPRQIVAKRQAEQRAAAKILGVKNVYFCDYQDCNLAVRNDVKRDIVRVIRKVRPDVLLTMDPTMCYSVSRGSINHSDHRAAGQAALDAVFPLARDYLAFPELAEKEKLEPHKVATVLLINYDRANFYIDITDTIDTKIDALAAHSSQFPDMPATERLVREHAADDGVQAGVKYAEAFIRLDIPS